MPKKGLKSPSPQVSQFSMRSDRSRNTLQRRPSKVAQIAVAPDRPVYAAIRSTREDPRSRTPKTGLNSSCPQIGYFKGRLDRSGKHLRSRMPIKGLKSPSPQIGHLRVRFVDPETPKVEDAQKGVDVAPDRPSQRKIRRSGNTYGPRCPMKVPDRRRPRSAMLACDPVDPETPKIEDAC